MFRDSRQADKLERSYSVEAPVILENGLSNLLSFNVLLMLIYSTSEAHRQ